MSIGKIIEERIQEMEITQLEVAKRAGVSQATIFKMINTNTKHSLETISKVAKVLGLDAESIFLELHGFLKTEISATKEDPPDTETLMIINHCKKMTREEKQEVLKYLEDKELAKEYREKLKSDLKSRLNHA